MSGYYAYRRAIFDKVRQILLDRVPPESFNMTACQKACIGFWDQAPSNPKSDFYCPDMSVEDAVDCLDLKEVAENTLKLSPKGKKRGVSDDEVRALHTHTTCARIACTHVTEG